MGSSVNSVGHQSNKAEQDTHKSPSSCFDQLQSTAANAIVHSARALTAAFLLGAETKTEGGLYPDGTDGTRQLALGKKLLGPITPEGGGTVYIEYTFDNPAAPSGRSTGRCSGAIYNSKTIISAAHPFLHATFLDPSGIKPGALLPNLKITVGTGTNFRTDPGARYTVSKITTNPKFFQSSDRASTFDLSVLVLEEEIPNTLSANLSTNRPTVGSQVVLAGFGRSGTPNTGYIPLSDGFPRAGNSEIDPGIAVTASGQSSDFYLGTIFRNQTANPSGLRAAPGDSGGPVFVLDAQGKVLNLAGLVVSGPPSTQSSFSYFLDLTAPIVRNFIEQHAASPETPLPNLNFSIRDGSFVVEWPYVPNAFLETAPTPQGPWAKSPIQPASTRSMTQEILLDPSSLNDSGFFRLQRQ
jgi:hypothetical protein